MVVCNWEGAVGTGSGSGSGRVWSTTSVAVAVYCFGARNVRTTAVPTVKRKTVNATHQRAFSIETNWVRFIRVLVRTGSHEQR